MRMKQASIQMGEAHGREKDSVFLELGIFNLAKKVYISEKKIVLNFWSLRKVPI